MTPVLSSGAVCKGSSSAVASVAACEVLWFREVQLVVVRSTAVSFLQLPMSHAVLMEIARQAICLAVGLYSHAADASVAVMFMQHAFYGALCLVLFSLYQDPLLGERVVALALPGDPPWLLAACCRAVAPIVRLAERMRRMLLVDAEESLDPAVPHCIVCASLAFRAVTPNFNVSYAATGGFASCAVRANAKP